MFDVPEILRVLKESGASDLVVERVESHFTTRMDQILEDMAQYFLAQEQEGDSEIFTNNNLKNNSDPKVGKNQEAKNERNERI